MEKQENLNKFPLANNPANRMLIKEVHFGKEIWLSLPITREFFLRHGYTFPIRKCEDIQTYLANLRRIANQYFDEILNIYYTEPDSRHAQKYSSRYEKFLYRGKKYKTDIFSSEDGKVIFNSFLMVNFLEKIVAVEDYTDILIIPWEE